MTALEAFQAELATLRERAEDTYFVRRRRQLDELKNRLNLLNLSWVQYVRPTLDTVITSKKELYRLQAELEALARMTLNGHSIKELRVRLRRANEMAASLIIMCPSADTEHLTRRIETLFMPEIPDIPAELVPESIWGWKTKMQDFLKEYPFDRSVFIMIRYRKKNDSIIAAIKEVVTTNELNPIVAGDHDITDDLYNPIACLMCCARGIAVFDKGEVNEIFNPNVAYELGMFHLLGRKCLILKHKSLRSLHTDILMKLYQPFGNAADIRARAANWLKKSQT